MSEETMLPRAAGGKTDARPVVGQSGEWLFGPLDSYAFPSVLPS